MRWYTAYTTAFALAIFEPQSKAFQFQPSSRRSSSATLRVGGMGWDNESFLEALGSGQDAIDKANEDYESLSRFGRRGGPAGEGDDYKPDAPDDLPDPMGGATTGAEITPEMKAKMKASHTEEEEAAQGGKMFRQLMERAQQAPSHPPPPPPEMMTPYQPPPPVTSQTAPPMPADPSSMSVEEQARMFREMMAQEQQQQPGAAAYPPPPPVAPEAPPSRSGLAPDGRRTGRNRDADAIVNTADMYFAQLKRDSSIRNVHRYSGDIDKANAVFEDPEIHKMKLHVNPYLEEARKKEAELLETAADEMLELAMWQEKPKQTVDYSGPSYKDKLQQLKAKKTGKSSGTAAATVEKEPKAKAPEVKSPKNIETEPQMKADPVAKTETPANPAPAEVEQRVRKAQVTAEPAAAAPLKTEEIRKTPERREGTEKVASSGDLHTDIRTLMGLIIKHRGGPGFGKGRIEGQEALRLEALASGVTEALRYEATMYPQQSEEAGKDLKVESPPAPTVQSSSTPSSTQAVAVPGRSEETQSGSITFPNADRINSMIACIDGAIQVYKNSPPEIRESVLITLRAALLSAVNTCNDLIGEDAPQFGGSPTQADGGSPENRINSMIECVEGATQMYKNAPPELQPPILLTLRAALLSAVNTLNKLIAESEVKNYEAYQTRVVEPSQSSRPAEYTDVVPEIQEKKEEQEKESITVEPAAEVEPKSTEAAAPVYSGNDANSKVLDSVYEKLKAAAGDGKMGLRKDLSPDDAVDLADSIAEMRALLVGELENGIPEKENEEENQTTSDPSADTSSKYQEMLAKARAEKAKKDKQ